MRTGPTMPPQMLWPLKVAATIRTSMGIWHIELQKMRRNELKASIVKYENTLSVMR